MSLKEKLEKATPVTLKEYNKYNKGYDDGYKQGQADERAKVLEEIEDRISEVTWYQVYKGKLVEGANPKDNEPLYKYKDIKNTLEKLKENQMTQEETIGILNDMRESTTNKKEEAALSIAIFQLIKISDEGGVERLMKEAEDEFNRTNGSPVIGKF